VALPLVMPVVATAGTAAAGTAGLVASVFAQDGGGTSFDPVNFVQYGALGLVIASLLMGWLWAKPAVDRLLADKQKLEDRNDALVNTYETRVMPVLADTASAVKEITPMVGELPDLLSRLETVISELKQHTAHDHSGGSS
jgi:hypothetical protein